MLGKTNRSTGEHERLDLAAGQPWDPAAIWQEQKVSLGVGRDWVPPKVNGWQSPSREAVSCWNHCPGAVASSVRCLPGETRALEAAVCRWDAADGDDGSRRAGLRAHRCRPGSLAGSGWAVGVCPACSGSPARSWSPGRSPSVRGRGRAGPRGGRRRRQRAPERGPAAAAGPGALFLEQRQALRGRGQERGEDHGDSNVRAGEARREDACGGLGGGDWRADPPPSTRPPGPRVSRPRSPRPPPIQRPASSRPGSPGNH